MHPTSWQPSALRLWTTILWSCLESFTTECTIFKLQCYVVCTRYSHNLLFYTSVCQLPYRVKHATVIYTATALLQMDFSSTCLIIVFTPHQNTLGLKEKQQQYPCTLLIHALSSQGSPRTSSADITWQCWDVTITVTEEQKTDTHFRLLPHPTLHSQMHTISLTQWFPKCGPWIP